MEFWWLTSLVCILSSCLSPYLYVLKTNQLLMSNTKYYSSLAFLPKPHNAAVDSVKCVLNQMNSLKLLRLIQYKSLVSLIFIWFSCHLPWLSKISTRKWQPEIMPPIPKALSSSTITLCNKSTPLTTWLVSPREPCLILPLSPFSYHILCLFVFKFISIL